MCEYKLTSKDVNEIKLNWRQRRQRQIELKNHINDLQAELYNITTTGTAKAIAKKYGVSYQTIYRHIYDV